MWPKLVAHAEAMQSKPLTTLFSEDSDRADRFTIEASGITLDYSKNFYDADTEQLLIQLAEESNIESLRRQMFSGAHLNNTEDRPALHTLLRGAMAPKGLEAEFEQVTNTLARVSQISSKIRSGEWRGSTGQTIKQVLHLGIGGSYLGPKMVDEALAAQRGSIQADLPCHYVANVDAHHLEQIGRAHV